MSSSMQKRTVDLSNSALPTVYRREWQYTVYVELDECGNITIDIGGGRGDWVTTHCGPFWARLEGFGGENAIVVEVMPLNNKESWIFVYESCVAARPKLLADHSVNTSFLCHDIGKAILKLDYL